MGSDGKAAFDFGEPGSRGELAEYLGSLRREGRRIVFTNGCFDILHVGHLRYLRDSRAAGDFLVVGLNTDESVRKNKGSGRPIVPQEERAEMLLGLSCVDAVVLFGEETPKDIIEFVRPDVLVKGAQYAEDEIVGADFIRSSGGRLIRAEMTEGASSTGIIERIIEIYGGEKKR